LLIVYEVAFCYFPKGIGDISENDEKVVDSRMQKGLLHAAIRLLLLFSKRVVDSLLECFSQVVESLLKGFAWSLHLI
jgi:hypothetical protein